MSAADRRAELARLLQRRTAQLREAPVSHAQRRLWLLDRIEPGSALYNISRAVRLRGHLDRDALARSFSALVARHESLRTAFALAGDVPVQRIHPAFEVAIATPALRASAPADRRAEAEERARADAIRPFDLETPPLFRVCLLEIDAREHLLVLTLHHIVTDGWSMGVLARELAALYRAFVRGEPASLPPLPIQYADFARWQHDPRARAALAEDQRYWQHQLDGAPQILELPSAAPRPGVRRDGGAIHHFALPAAVMRRVYQLARASGATAYMVMLAALYALLHRYTGREDILVGSTVAGRRDPTTEPLIGFFVNTLVLRGRPRPGTSFRALLAHARETVLAAHEHQGLPFELLVDDLCTERDLAYTPMFQVCIDYQTAAPGIESWAGLEVGPWAVVDRRVAHFDLSLLLEELPDGGVRGMIQYSTDLFTAPFIARMSEHLRVLVSAAARAPERPIGALPLLTADERQTLLTTWNQTAREAPLRSTLPALFAAQAARTPTRVALAYGDERLTYAALARRVNQLAWLLVERGVTPGAPVALAAERSLEMVVGLLGILAAGGCYVPLDPDYPDERLRFMLADCGAALVVTTSRLGDRLAQLGERVTPLALDLDPDVDQPSDHGPPVSLSADDPAYIIYTSGSTGTPKGVQVPHRGPIALVSGADYAALGAHEVLLHVAPLSFDLSVFNLFAALLGGHTLALLEPGTPTLAGLHAAVERHRATVLFLSTGLFQLVVEERPEIFARLRHVLVGGDVLPPASARRLRLSCPDVRLTNAYGPTEATVLVTSHLVDDVPADRLVPIGRPIPNTTLYVLDGNRQPVPVGVPGELYIGGPGVALGYFQRPELTRASFLDDPFDERPGSRLYRSGDRVKYLEDGNLEFLGRIDDQVKVRGFRIELGEVELALQRHPAVRIAAAAVVGDSAGDRRLIGYYVGDDDAPSTADLLADLRARMPEYMVPTVLVRMDQIPLSPSGKVDRQALPLPSHAAADDAPVWPRTDLERQLAEIWSEVLGGRPMAVNRDFFALGGHSLRAMQVASRVRERLGRELSLKTIFRHPTIAALAQALPAPPEAPPDGPAEASPGAPATVGDTADENRPPALRRLPRAPDEDGVCWFPVSNTQRRMWFLDRLEAGDSRFYNIPWALRLDGALDVARLRHALRALQARHEALRTVFVTRQGEPRQAVRPDPGLALPVLDLAGLPETARAVAVAEHLAAEAEHRFDLERGPLLRVQLLRLDDDQHLLLGNVHHIVMDGWSLDLVVRELAALYAGTEAATALPAPAVQYGDYAAWQQAWLRSRAPAAQLAYWRDQLRDAPALLTLPTDRVRPAVQTFRGAQHRFAFPDALANAVRALGQRLGATPFAVLLTAFHVLLHRYSGQDDIIVGTPVANRGRVELEGTVGAFINTLAIRVDLGDDPTYAALLAQVQQTAVDAQSHQELPFEHILDALGVPRSLSHAPLFQVLFVMQNALLDLPPFADLAVEQVAVPTSTALLDLSLTLRCDGRGLGGFVEYNTDLFDAASARRLVAHFERLLRGVAADPERPISAYPLASDDEHRLLQQWSRGRREAPAPYPVHHMIARAAAAAPAATAVIGQTSLTYGVLLDRVHRLAHHLRSLGASRGTVIGVCLPRSVEFVVAVLATLETGAAFLPINPREPGDRKRYIAEDAGLDIVLVDKDGRPGLDAVAHCLVLRPAPAPADSPGAADAADTAGPPAAPPLFATEPGWDDVAYILYTSGSTGRPKGVRVSHRAFANHCRGIIGLFALRPTDRALQFASVGFDVALEEIMPTLAAGATLVLRPDGPVSLSGFTRAIIEQRISVLNLPAAFWHAWVDELTRRGAPSLPSLRLLVTGSDRVLPERLARWRHAYGASIRWLSGYGPTEATISVSFYEAADELPTTAAVPLGRPLPNVRVHVADPRGGFAPIGVPGEICVGGDAVALGYLRRDELTAAKFVPDPFSDDKSARMYKTGDLGRVLPGGDIEFLGRADQQVKLRGFRIELGEIESCLRRQPHVADAAALIQQTPSGHPHLAAYVAATPGHALTAEALTTALGSALPAHMVPERVAVLPALPRTHDGKLDRRALPAPSREPGAVDARTPPASARERLISAVWSEVLGIAAPDILTNFFDLGGNSLALAKVHALLEDRLGQPIAFHDLFKHPTIRALSSALGRSDENPAPAASARGPRPRGPRDGAIAIIGMAGRFPGASSPHALWTLLRDGAEGLTRLSDDQLAAAGVPEDLRRAPGYVPVTGLAADVDRFDAAFFGYTPREAEVIDPQQRVLLECSWEALEDAGYVPDAQTRPVGVFCGTATSTYLIHHLLPSPDPDHRSNAVMMQNDINSAATRISYKLDLRGPSLSVQTACSTSLVAVHAACRSLLAGECDMALAGGASIRFPAPAGYTYAKESISSPDGHCRAFDAQAAGTVPSNGAAMVLLKPLADALRDGDVVYATILGSAINNDGATKVGYTAPSLPGHVAVIRDAWAAAGVEPHTIRYIEAHGTGTLLGDPVEVAAFNEAFASTDAELAQASCALGSVKTNIGHLDVAAGVAGLIKAALMLRHGELVPSLHYQAPNPKIHFAAGPLYVNTETRPWPRASGPRRAGVSSLGMGGTNAHVVLEEPPEQPEVRSLRALHVLPLSARTPEDLDAACVQLARALRERRSLPFADVCYTRQVGGKRFPQRRALLCRDREEALALLEQGHPRRVLDAADQRDTDADVVFLFPGQGAQHPGMGAELYRHEPGFRRAVDECLGHLPDDDRQTLAALLLSPRDFVGDAAVTLRRTEYAQPALFIVEYAAARLMMSWGVTPTALFGHSIGEYVAAALAGVFELGDAVRLVRVRGRLVQSLPAGDMLAVSLSETELGPLLDPALSVAAVNAPTLCVASGPAPAVAALAADLRARGVEHRRLHTSHAFHSAMMDPVREALAVAVARARPRPPTVPVIADVTGTWMTDAQATDPGYWTAQLRAGVRFSDGVASIMERGAPVLLELGPGTALSTLASRRPEVRRERVIATMRRPGEPGGDVEPLTRALARLWLMGARIDWAAVHGSVRRRVSLPTYPFSRQRFFVAADDAARSGPTTTAAVGDDAVSTYQRPGLDATYLAPRTPAEVAWAAIWRRVFGYEQIGVRDNFYDLGGDSMLGLRMISLADERGLTVSLSDLFEHQTIEALAGALPPSPGGPPDDDDDDDQGGAE